jgi:hypothetical protein
MHHDSTRVDRVLPSESTRIKRCYPHLAPALILTLILTTILLPTIDNDPCHSTTEENPNLHLSLSSVSVGRLGGMPIYSINPTFSQESCCACFLSISALSSSGYFTLCSKFNLGSTPATAPLSLRLLKLSIYRLVYTAPFGFTKATPASLRRTTSLTFPLERGTLVRADGNNRPTDSLRATLRRRAAPPRLSTLACRRCSRASTPRRA